jgi:hypothetical protein
MVWQAGSLAKPLVSALLAGLVTATAGLAQGSPAPPIPDRRVVLTTDSDLPGGDIASIFDTTAEACARACLANAQCLAFTFNTRNGSCFAKSAIGQPLPYAGAVSGVLVQTDPAVLAAAPDRRAEMSFLSDYDVEQARLQAAGLGQAYPGYGTGAEGLMQSAAAAEAAGDPALAATFAAAAVAATDAPDLWAEYARLQLLAGQPEGEAQRAYLDGALSAAVNGALRAADPGLRHNLLVLMAQALEATGRGNLSVQALRLAQALQPRDDTALALDDAIGKYGFRLIETDVQSDGAEARICVNFSEDLARSGVDYATYVQLPDPGLTVVQGAFRQLCVEGVQHGARYSVTFREGLPAANGETLQRSVAITQYVRDRRPAARFPGRAYVLPKAGGANIPVQTVNTETLDLALYRVSDRNLLRAIQSDFFAQPIPAWAEESFSGRVGEELWTGTATVAMEINRDVTTRLPMDAAIAGLPAGIYALRASAPGTDPYDIAPAWQWFVISDLGVTTLSGVDGLNLFVRSLATASAKPGVTVELLSQANAVLATATTDAAGHARFDPGLTRGTGGAAPALVTLRDGDGDIAFLSLGDPEFDLSDRGVEGREAAGPVDVFLTTDRGAYRAGETVHMTALARDGRARAVEGLPLTAVLKRPDGVEWSRQLVEDAGAGGHVAALPIAGAAPRGIWRLELVADPEAPPLARKTFLVEDFLPERIDFTLSLPDRPIRLGDTVPLSIGARFLFGAPGADLAVEGEVTLAAATALPGYPGYVFGRHDEPFATRVEPLDSGARTDAAGQAQIAVALPDIEDPGRPLEARLTVRLAEGSGRPVERQIARPVAAAAPVIGIRPEFDGAVPEGTEARFRLIGVGPDGAPAPMTVAWELTRLETTYQWYQQFGQWFWEPVTSRNRVARGTADLGLEPAALALPVTWGEYELSVERTGGAYAATSTTFTAGWYAAADASTTPDMLEASLDRAAYAPGDTVVFRIVPRAAGTALVTVLSDRLIAMQAVEVTEGENLIRLPVTDDWGAGVYVAASVIRPMDVDAGRNPARALGLAHALIDPGPAELAATIETAAEAAPRGPLDIAVRVEGVAPGDTAHVTIAAVDQGILNLTAFAPPDPAAHYFGQRKLGVGIRDLYGRLIDGQTGAEGTIRSGGDAGAQARLQAPPPTEELVAFFTGPVAVGPDGLARARFDLPAFDGTVKVMAVAWSETGVGQASADVLVRDPVVVTASLPRFLAPGDTSRLLLEIAHATGPAGRIGLDVTATGLNLGAVPSGLDLAEGGRGRITVPVTAGDPGVRTVSVALTTPDGRQLTKDLTLPVEVNDPELVRISRFDLAPGQTFTLDGNAFAGLVPGTAKATLAAGPIARLNAPGLLAALDRYPFGCTEQIASRALPLLYLSELAEAMNLATAATLTERLDQSVAEILANQSANGAFGLWSPGSGDFWLDAFVTDVLSRARAQGIAVPDTAFRAALDNLRNQVNFAPDFDWGGEALAYALMVLAREGAAAVGDLRYYADVKGDAFATPAAAAQLGAALASYGDQRRADAMFARAAALIAELPPTEIAQVFRADYGTHLRDAAAVLALAGEAGSLAVDRDALAARIAAHAGQFSPQEATWTLLAARVLLDAPGGGALSINGEPLSGPLVQVLDGQAAVPIAVTNTGTAPETVTLTTFGVPSEPVAAGGNGYAITRSYVTLDGAPADPSTVAAGTRLVTLLDITPFAEGEARLMVTDPLPAGFEIDNPNLISGGDISALADLGLEAEAAHSEFRQDRFLTAIDRMDGAPFRLGYIVRAVSPGSFHHPAASVEDMYRPDFRARSAEGRVTVTD